MRLDKLLAHSGFGTRKQVKKIIKDGYIQVNGKRQTSPKFHVDPNIDAVLIGGQPIHYQKYSYFMMYKPSGVITATEDILHETVFDLLEPQDFVKNLHAIGRLDIDTEGLLLLTNDGQLTHRLTSPHFDIPKVYYAEVDGIVGEKDIQLFAEGLALSDFEAKPAKLKILEIDEKVEISKIQLTISEGKFHQVKRMFETVRKSVNYLKRTALGPIHLDPELLPGTYRELNEDEIQALASHLAD